MRYRIDEQHPAVMAVLDEAVPTLSQVRTMLRILEETIPVVEVLEQPVSPDQNIFSLYSGKIPADSLEAQKAG